MRSFSSSRPRCHVGAKVSDSYIFVTTAFQCTDIFAYLINHLTFLIIYQKSVMFFFHLLDTHSFPNIYRALYRKLVLGRLKKDTEMDTLLLCKLGVLAWL